MKLDFCDHRLLILGGSSDLGLAIARQALSEGLHVTMTGSGSASLERMAEVIGHGDGQADGQLLDMNDVGSVEALLHGCQTAPGLLADCLHPHLEELVAAAAMEEVEDYFGSALIQRARLLQHLSRAMLSRRRGRMVHISSGAAGQPASGQGFYAASKLAVEGIYRSLGLELAPRGITTCSLRPGYIHCGRARSMIDEQGQQLLERIPAREVLAVEDVARTVLFLLSQSARGINATVVTMDGGMRAGKG
ncbi:short-chain dehydrogenase/reductase SDR [Desulfurispirillum indicum S5]|uniref:Short-chain dehydrogenase/reductase SDR n=1 Tax=Desulfurispirillum indicum (strain ATCC BAA-1389 / DSM 22839 / S5) TaxID=653733 RepID=E6W0J1_DESIS|nr:SDR family oxidoreductase [Desulfurispirillum indicum]ADU65243.1 short-chain dehydrogenase/reductase SDR [Desulfurispirillum indicum S5]